MSRSPFSPTTDNWSIEEAKRTYHIDRVYVLPNDTQINNRIRN